MSPDHLRNGVCPCTAWVRSEAALSPGVGVPGGAASAPGDGRGWVWLSCEMLCAQGLSQAANLYANNNLLKPEPKLTLSLRPSLYLSQLPPVQPKPELKFKPKPESEPKPKSKTKSNS